MNEPNSPLADPTDEKQILIDRVIESIKADLANGDETVLDELLGMVPTPNLIMALPEAVWGEFGGVQPKDRGQFGGIHSQYEQVSGQMNEALIKVGKQLADRSLIVFSSAPGAFEDDVNNAGELAVGESESVNINYAPGVSWDSVFGICNRGLLVERYSGNIGLARLEELSLNEKKDVLESIEAAYKPITVSKAVWKKLPQESVFDVEPVVAG